MIPREVLEAIRAADPDGQDFGESGPAESDYRAFKVYVMTVWGQKAWEDYNKPWRGEGTYE